MGQVCFFQDQNIYQTFPYIIRNNLWLTSLRSTPDLFGKNLIIFNNGNYCSSCCAKSSLSSTVVVLKLLLSKTTLKLQKTSTQPTLLAAGWNSSCFRSIDDAIKSSEENFGKWDPTNFQLKGRALHSHLAIQNMLESSNENIISSTKRFWTN